MHDASTSPLSHSVVSQSSSLSISSSSSGQAPQDRPLSVERQVPTPPSGPSPSLHHREKTKNLFFDASRLGSGESCTILFAHTDSKFVSDAFGGFTRPLASVCAARVSANAFSPMRWTTLDIFVFRWVIAIFSHRSVRRAAPELYQAPNLARFPIKDVYAEAPNAPLSTSSEAGLRAARQFAQHSAFQFAVLHRLAFSALDLDVLVEDAALGALLCEAQAVGRGSSCSPHALHGEQRRHKCVDNGLR